MKKHIYPIFRLNLEIDSFEISRNEEAPEYINVLCYTEQNGKRARECVHEIILKLKEWDAFIETIQEARKSRRNSHMPRLIAEET